MKKIDVNILRSVWLSFCLAFFLFFSKLRSYTDYGNRAEVSWSLADLGVIYASAAIIGGVVFGTGWFLKRMGLSGLILDRLYIVLAFFSAGFALSVFVVNDIVMRWIGPFEPFNFLRSSDIYFYGPFVNGLLRYLFFFLCVYGITVGIKPVKKFLTLLILTVSPITIVYPLVALSYDSIPMQRGVPETHLTDKSDTDQRIYFFLFDMWDYQNTFRNSLGPLELPGLKNLADVSTLYHNAITPSTFTEKSVTKMIGGYGEGEPNIFTQARETGWSSYIVAAYLPYQLWYGASVDYCLRVVWFKMRGLPTRLLYEIKNASLSALSFWAPDWAEPRAFEESAVSHRHQTNEVHRNVLDVISRGKGRGLYYFHYPIPHWPFFNEPELRRNGVPIKEAQARGFRYNLREVDKCIEEIVATLKRSHQWDNSLVIFTGDHGWRMDPMRPRALIENKHVPLYVKFPGQRKGRDVHERYDMENLKNLIEKELAVSARPTF